MIRVVFTPGSNRAMAQGSTFSGAAIFKIDKKSFSATIV
jgi:hypothetical protein